MSDEIYTEALLAAAAYADWGAGDVQAIRLILGDKGLTDAQIEDMFYGPNPRYSVIGYAEESNGFSATIFKNIEVGSANVNQLTVAFRGTDGGIIDAAVDWLGTNLEVVFGDALFLGLAEFISSQDNTITEFFELNGLVSNGVLSGGVNFAGHSLGGYLATMASYKYHSTMGHAYTFNGLGVSDSDYEQYALLNEISIDGKVSNFYGDLVGPYVGINPGPSTEIFIEKGTVLSDHGIARLVESLSVYRLMVLLDLSLDDEPGLGKIKGILEAASSQADQSLETITNSLRDLLGTKIPLVSVTETDIETIYQAAESYIGNLGGPLTITGLPDMSPSYMEAQAESSIAYRYAILNLLPFVVEGDASIYDQHNTSGQLDYSSHTEEYWQSRSLFLQLLLDRNAVDSSSNESVNELLPQEYFYDEEFDQSVTVGEVNSTPFENVRRTLFGSDSIEGFADGFEGGSSRDFLFGLGGHDILKGKAGNDHIEGGAGNDLITGGTGIDSLRGGADDDTYFYSTGDGLDFIVDDEGANRLNINTVLLENSAGIFTQSYPGSNTYVQLDAGSGQVILGSPSIVKNGTDIRVHINSGLGGAIKINDWDASNNNFGLTLTDVALVTPTPPPLADTWIITNTMPQNGVNSNSIQNADTGSELFSTADTLRYYWFRDGNTGVQGPIPSGDSNNLNLLFHPDNYFAYSEASTDWGTGIGFAVEGGDLADVITGGSREDNLFGHAGSDIIHGGDNDSGYEYIRGGAGSDYLYGDAGNDVIWGTNNLFENLQETPNPDPTDLRVSEEVGDSDYIEGNTGNDRLSGGNFNDIILGGTENDHIYGGAGNDWLQGGEHDDVIYGDARLDATFSNVTAPGVYDVTFGLVDPSLTATGFTYDDHIDGGAGDDILRGGAGHDVLSGGAGTDYLHGDTLWLDPQGMVLPRLSDGNDVLFGGTGTDYLWGHGGDDTLFGGDDNDQLSGDTSDSNLPGEEHGDDYLNGGAGIDTLWGNGGDDLLVGGAGDDILYGDNTSLAIQFHGDDTLEGGEGIDQLVGQGGDDELSGGAGDDSLWGDEGDDQLRGGAGNDYLNGGSDDDSLTGDQGTDFLEGGAGNDVYHYALGDGTDVITDTEGSNTLSLSFNANHITGYQQQAGGSVIALANNNDDFIQLSPLTGNTMSIQFADGTTMAVNDIAQVVFLAAGFTEVTTGVGNDDVIGSDLADTITTGAGDDMLDGNLGDDTLHGDIGNDQLNGGGGIDTLQGGEGDDSYLAVLGGGADIIDNTDAQDGFDRLILSGGVDPSLTTPLKDGDDLTINTGTDIITVTNHFKDFGTALNRVYALDAIVFDGFSTTWTTQDIASAVGLPFALGESLTISGGTDTTILFAQLLNNDTPGLAGPLSITAVGSELNGTALLDPLTDTILFTPQADYFGEASFDYTVSDGATDFIVTASLELTNASPTPMPDTISIYQDQVIQIPVGDLLENDTDLDGHDLEVISVVAAGIHGQASLNGGVITFTPESGYVGDGSFEYTVSDGYAQATSSVSVDIGIANVAPTPVDDTVYAGINHARVIPFWELLENDTDLNNDNLTILSVGPGVNGAAQIVPGTETITFTPDPDHLGSASFTYVVSDGSPLTAVGTVNLEVLDVTVVTGTQGDDDIEGALYPDDNYLIFGLGGVDTVHRWWGGHDVIYGGMGNDVIEAGSGDDIVYGGPGDDHLEGQGGNNIIYGGTGNDTIQGHSFASSGTVYGGPGDDVISEFKFATGGPGNDIFVGGPFFRNTYYYNLGDGIDTIYKLGPGSLAEIHKDRVIFGSDIDQPTHMAFDGVEARFNNVGIVFGSLREADVYFVYSDGTEFAARTISSFVILAGPDSEDYRAYGEGPNTVVGDLSSNNQIYGGAGDDYLVAIGGSDTVAGGAGNDIFEIGFNSIQSHSFFGGIGDDVFVLSPSLAYGSSVITLSGYILNGEEAGDDRLLIDMNTIDPSTVELRKNGDDLLFDYAIGLGSGLIRIVDHFKDYGLADNRDNALDRIEFRNLEVETDYAEANPSLSWDKVLYAESEPVVIWNQQYIAEAVDLVWSGASEVIVNTDSVMAALNEPKIIAFADVFANDSVDGGGTPTLESVWNARNGTVTANMDEQTITFVPDDGFTGDARFDYTVNDGYYTNTGTVRVTVVSNVAPELVPDFVNAVEDTERVLSYTDLLGNDIDPESDALDIVSVGAGINGVATLNPGLQTVTFMPAADYNGQASFEYSATDGFSTRTEIVNVTVAAVNDAPNAVEDIFTTIRNTDLIVPFGSLTANDSDIEMDPFFVATAVTVANGSVEFDADNQQVTFTPDANFEGVAAFIYILFDGSDFAAAPVYIDVTPPPNQLPIAGLDTFATLEDTSFVIRFDELLVNDSDPDSSGVLSILSTLNAVGGNPVINLEDEEVVFYPDANFYGTATFEYELSDGSDSVNGQVTVNVAAVNDAPTAVQDEFITIQDTDLVVLFDDLTGNDYDIDMDTFSVAGAAEAAGGTVDFDAINQQITFTPDANFEGVAAFVYALFDGVELAAALVFVDVLALDPDVFDVGADSLYGDLSIGNRVDFAELLSNDFDYAGGAPGITNVTTDGLGVLDLDIVAGQFTYTPAAGETSVDFTYILTDGSSAGSGLATMQLGSGTVLTNGIDDWDGTSSSEWISALDGDDDINSKGGDDVISGGIGDDLIRAGDGDDILIGGLGEDDLKGVGHDDHLWGGAGNDTLSGGTGNDTYYFDLGDGQDIVNNSAGSFATDVDVIEFLDRVAPEDLWFSQLGNDLVIDVIGTDDQVTISKWYQGDNYEVDQIATSAGTLDADSIDSLVTAMAAYTAPDGIGAEWTPAMALDLQPDIDAAWDLFV